MSATPRDIDAVLDAMPERKAPSTAATAALLAAVLGLGIGLVYGFLVAGPAWTWGAFLVALIYTLGLGQAGVVFSLIMQLTWARWGQPVKRIAESFAFFLPIGYLLLLVFLLAGNGLYPWHEGTFLVDEPIAIAPHSPEVPHAKETWLNLPFFIARHAIGFALLLLLDFLFLRASLRPDLQLAKQRLGDRYTVPGWLSWAAGAGGDLEGNVLSASKTKATLGVIIGALYALLFSMLAFDLIMSLSPWWFANMFGAWFFASTFWTGLAMTGLVAMLSRDWLGITGWVTPKVTHDIGKLLLAFCMFWAYTAFAQILPIWYTNMPEETSFLLIRLTLPEWAWLSHLVAVTCFIAPFTILLSRGLKKMKAPFIAICLLILTGIFLERTLLVMPSVWFDDSFPVLNFLLVSIPLWLGFLGVFFSVVLRVLAAVPPLPVTDPFLDDHPWDVHVHSLDEHAAHHAK